LVETTEHVVLDARRDPVWSSWRLTRGAARGHVLDTLDATLTRWAPLLPNGAAPLRNPSDRVAPTRRRRVVGAPFLREDVRGLLARCSMSNASSPSSTARERRDLVGLAQSIASCRRCARSRQRLFGVARNCSKRSTRSRRDDAHLLDARRRAALTLREAASCARLSLGASVSRFGA